MANSRDVRLRMKAIKQTLQITKAMNLISTSKLRKGRRVLENTVPFFNRIQTSMFDILSGAGKVKSDFFNPQVRDGNVRTAIIVVTSDKGLAGGYNANIFREVTRLCGEVKNPILILIGAIGYRYFIHSPYLIIENFSYKSRLPELDDAKEIADYMISQYSWGMFNQVHIVYTHMYSSIKLIPTARQILPVNAGLLQKKFEAEGAKRTELQFEYWPSQEIVFDTLAPLYVKGIIYGALVEAYTSEQSARMSAMDEATKNGEDMLNVLQINYNRARQAGITQEMTEIIGGSQVIAR
jgi:F-type H+-transporting ATPase subunit gamma